MKRKSVFALTVVMAVTLLFSLARPIGAQAAEIDVSALGNKLAGGARIDVARGTDRP